MKKETWAVRTMTGYYVTKTKRSVEWPDAELFSRHEAERVARRTDDAVQIESASGAVVGLSK